jgi:hypothetical protein
MQRVRTWAARKRPTQSGGGECGLPKTERLAERSRRAKATSIEDARLSRLIDQVADERRASANHKEGIGFINVGGILVQ